MFRSILTLSLLSSLALIVYQRIHISNLSHELSSFSCGSGRSKRSLSISDGREEEEEEGEGKEETEQTKNSVYFPVYAQISKKAMRKLCHEERRGKRKGGEKKGKKIKEKTRREQPPEMKRGERKKCSREVAFSSPRLISRRSHWNGCALRDGSTWFVCEFHMGYTLLEYADTPSLSASLPRALRTLPFPYSGTDGTAVNGSVAYAHDDQIVLHNFASSSTNRLPLNINQAPLYNGSFSRMDIQSDEHGLWVLYRERERETLTVSRVSLPALKMIQTWQLSLRPSLFCNSFIRCGILHSISCSLKSASIEPVYDFYSATPIVGKQTIVPGIREDVNSAQYDPVSHSLSIFSRGLIYSIPIGDSA